MSVYQRYASGNHDDIYFNQSRVTSTETSLKYSPSTNFTTKTSKHISNGVIELSPLSGQFDPNNDDKMNSSSVSDWLSVFPHAVFFAGYDEQLFDSVIVVVYENSKSGKICTLSITKFGVVLYQNLILDSRSRFWPSCENLLPEHQKSNVRRALAITMLKNYNRLMNHPGELSIDRHWDETNAGTLASSMGLLSLKKPLELGCKLLELGVVQSQAIQSVVVDVIYNSSDEIVVKKNNDLVFLLGEQLDQLFDPLLEYSPQQMDIQYSIPDPIDFIPPQISNNDLIDAIINEIVAVQTNFTMGLVNLLQNFVIPLRVYVLGTAKANSGISNINQVFPPTIDEITRINCILHGNLEKASKLGYMEVFKLMGVLLPYFYKAFIRHEANLKHFRSRLNRFYKRNKSTIFENEAINKGKFSLTEMDSIINGSLLELPRLKLILKRLYDTILQQKAGLLTEIEFIDKHYNNAIAVIDAFGYEESGNAANGFGSQHRIFTPTGKLLTELASSWPSELQYGWMSRKVVGIYELRAVKQDVLDTDIMIIFSDHLMFLNILDDRYYSEEEEFMKISLADVLMHSLINEKPLPSLSKFPSMHVKYWCKINDVIASSYRGFSSEGSTQDEFIRILNISEEGFMQTDAKENVRTLSYQISRSDDRVLLSNKIIELINKSKVLHKSQPFHLFKSQDSSFPIYSTAHELSCYSKEVSKSPYTLLLNYSNEDARNFFYSNPNVFLQLNLSFINDHTIHIAGMSKLQTFEEVIVPDDLIKCLKEIIAKNYNYIFSSYNPITAILSSSYRDDLHYYINALSTEEPAAKASPKSMLLASEEVPEKLAEKNFDASPAKAPTKPPVKGTQIGKKEVRRNKDIPRRRKSLIKIIIDAFKKHDRIKAQEHSEHQTAPEPEAGVHRETQRNGSDHTIPNGEKKRFSNIYLPSPDLERIMTEEEEAKQAIKFKPHSRLPSLDFNARFRFPHPTDPTTNNKVVEENRVFSRASEALAVEKGHSTFGSELAIAEPANVHNPLRIFSPTSFYSLHSEDIDDNEVKGQVEGSLAENKQVKDQVEGGLVENNQVKSTRVDEQVHLQVDDSQASQRKLVEDVPAKAVDHKQAKSLPQMFAIKQPVKIKFKRQAVSKSDTAAAPVPKANQKLLSIWKAADTQQLSEPKAADTQRVISETKSGRTRTSLELDAFDLQDFYKDGGSNWVTISRDTSLQNEIRALKEAAHMDSIDVIDIKEKGQSKEQKTKAHRQEQTRQLSEKDQSLLFDNVDLFLESLDEDVKSVYYTPAQDPTPVLQNFEPQRDESVQSLQSIASLSSSKYVKEFNRLMDKKFADFDTIGESQFHLDYEEPESDNETLKLGSDSGAAPEPPVTIKIVGDDLASAVPHQARATIISSSEDEYFSSQEYEKTIQMINDEDEVSVERRTISRFRLNYENLDAEKTPSTHNSTSSDVTIINDIMGEVPDKMTKMPGLMIKYDSVAYLSDVINGTVNFSLEDED